MNIEIYIKVSGDRVIITSSKGNIFIDVPNQIIYDKNTKTILGVGESPESIRMENESIWNEMKNQVEFAPIFDTSSLDRDYIFEAMLYFVKKVHYEIRPGIQFLMEFFDKLNVQLIFPKYETIPENQRKKLESKIYESIGVNNLIINGHAIGKPKWKWKSRKIT